MELVARSNQIAVSFGLALGPLCRPCTHNCITMEDGLSLISYDTFSLLK